MQSKLNMWTLHFWLTKQNIPHFYSLDDSYITFDGFRLSGREDSDDKYALLSPVTDNTMYRSKLSLGSHRIYFQDHGISEIIPVLNSFEMAFQNWLDTFFRLNLTFHPLETLLENAATFLPYPTIILCDSQMIAVGPNASDYADLMKTHLHQYSVCELLESELATELDLVYPIITTSKPFHPLQVMIDRVLIEQHYIWLIYFDPDCKLHHGDESLSYYLRNAVTNNLSHHSMNFLKRFTSLDDYFLSCMNHELPSRDLSRHIFNRLRWNPNGYFCIWRIELRDSSANFVMNIICRIAQRAFPNSHTMLCPNGILMIFNESNMQDLPDYRDIRVLFPAESFFIGKSNYEVGYELLPDLIRQAFHAVKSCQKNNRAYTDAKDIVSEFVSKKLYDNVSIQALIHPAIRLLSEIDKKQTSSFSYLLTLKTFLISGANYNETAKRLHIHRNTLVHRMQNIYDCAGIQPENLDFEALLLSIVLLNPN
ncbi:MAG: helix-turn-helix domain-containing protein [Eubacterium sp.]|nr:helix-turn-helix domain-containing protein [Eubacterium sp.]